MSWRRKRERPELDEREAALALYPPRPNHLEPGRSSAILSVGSLLTPPDWQNWFGDPDEEGAP